MSVIRVAHRYAKSLVLLGQETKTLDALQEEVKSMLQLIKSSKDLKFLLHSPIIKLQKKKAILNKLFEGKISDTLLRFIDLVVEKNRENVLPEILATFLEECNRIKGITQVTVTTAVAMKEDFVNSIMDILKKEFGLSKVELTTEVDEDIVGGFMLEFDNKRYDASVSHQLDRLRQTLLNAK